MQTHVLNNTIGLAQIWRNLHLHRFLSTETIRAITCKAIELKNQKNFGDGPSTGWAKLDLHTITENRWERLKRVPICIAAPEPDVTARVEKFESTFMPKHFGVELITPEFSFVEKCLK